MAHVYDEIFASHLRQINTAAGFFFQSEMTENRMDIRGAENLKILSCVKYDGLNSQWDCRRHFLSYFSQAFDKAAKLNRGHRGWLLTFPDSALLASGLGGLQLRRASDIQ